MLMTLFVAGRVARSLVTRMLFSLTRCTRLLPGALTVSRMGGALAVDGVSRTDAPLRCMLHCNR